MTKTSRGLKAIIIIVIASISYGNAQNIERKYLNNQTYEYHELIEAYKSLAEGSQHAKLISIDATDDGEQVKLFVIKNASKGNFNPYMKTGLGMLVMNGIHAGESCGIDASLHWAEEILNDIDKLGDATIYIIPTYNIGGFKNKSCCTRANQNGPENMGFRGNANNLDLNRDFMKMDASNTLAFRTILSFIDPDVFIDNHSTNGADYQYKMTLIQYQSEKWSKELQSLYTSWFSETKEMLNAEDEMAQYYVNVWGRTPVDGFSAFHASSIYSTGYAGLFRTFGITAEAHMFKTYPERVEATMATMRAVLATSLHKEKEIVAARTKALEIDQNMSSYPVNWALDSTKGFEINFKGYEVERFKSDLTGQDRYRYDRDNPITYTTNYYPSYKAVEEVNVPKFYVLRSGQHKAIANLMNANVQFVTIERDTTMTVSVQYVDDIRYSTRPYEGHFPHREFTLRTEIIEQHFDAGDLLINTAQPAIRFILEALEPQSPGSLFRWNYFDTYLQRKEGFSAYVFEEKAVAFLEENPEIKAEFEEWRISDESIKNNAYAQLYWIYKRTPYYEKEHMRIPVFRVY